MDSRSQNGLPVCAPAVIPPSKCERPGGSDTLQPHWAGQRCLLDPPGSSAAEQTGLMSRPWCVSGESQGRGVAGSQKEHSYLVHYCRSSLRLL